MVYVTGPSMESNLRSLRYFALACGASSKSPSCLGLGENQPNDNNEWSEKQAESLPSSESQCRFVTWTRVVHADSRRQFPSYSHSGYSTSLISLSCNATTWAWHSNWWLLSPILSCACNDLVARNYCWGSHRMTMVAMFVREEPGGAIN
jgi:hypothetical protein